jgi:hypothetical protein
MQTPDPKTATREELIDLLMRSMRDIATLEARITQLLFPSALYLNVQETLPCEVESLGAVKAVAEVAPLIPRPALVDNRTRFREAYDALRKDIERHGKGKLRFPVGSYGEKQSMQSLLLSWANADSFLVRHFRAEDTMVYCSVVGQQLRQEWQKRTREGIADRTRRQALERERKIA